MVMVVLAALQRYPWGYQCGPAHWRARVVQGRAEELDVSAAVVLRGSITLVASYSMRPSAKCLAHLALVSRMSLTPPIESL